MDRTIDFTVFCLESYKQAHYMNGKAALKVFDDYNVFGYCVNTGIDSTLVCKGMI
jgi:hypothetical protein